jgi:hypothetical protein
VLLKTVRVWSGYVVFSRHLSNSQIRISLSYYERYIFPEILAIKENPMGGVGSPRYRASGIEFASQRY